MPFAAALAGGTRDACRTYIRPFLTHRAHREDAFDEVLDAFVTTS